MKTIIKEFKVFAYSELSEKAKDYAFTEWQVLQNEFSWSSEYRETLKEFSDLFGIKVYNWNVNTWNYDFDFDTQIEEIPNTEKSKTRVNRYLINKFTDLDIDNCPLTGFCADYAILDTLKKVRSYEEIYNSYDDFIQDCLASFFSEWSKDMEYQESRECFEENYSCNNEYLENGEIFI